MHLHPKHDPTATQLSQSGMEMFYGCPHRLLLASQWEMTRIPTALTDGVAAHAILAGEEVPDASMAAVGYAENLWDMKENYGIELFAQEFTQVFEILPGIWYKRIIDGIGTYMDQTVLIDWKTSNKGQWPYFRSGREKIVPKARTFQAVSYLVPPPQEELDKLGISVWPSTILFLVSDASGHGDLYGYRLVQEDLDNFYNAARLMTHAIQENQFPKVCGYPCGTPGTSWACNYIELCYQVEGWEQYYRRIE